MEDATHTVDKVCLKMLIYEGQIYALGLQEQQASSMHLAALHTPLIDPITERKVGL